MAERWTDLFRGGRGRVLVFCALGWVFDFFDLILFAFVQGRVGEDLGLTTAQLGLVHGLTLAATAVGGMALGRLADRRGRRGALCLSILIYSGGAFATAFAQGFTSLLLARLVTGIGVGGEWGIGHAVVAETYPPSLRGRAAGVLQALSPVAMMMAALVGLLAAPEIGWRACFLLAGVPALLVFAARWALPGRDRVPGAGRGRFADLFRRPYRRASTGLLLVLVLHMTGFWCVYSWLPRLLREEMALAPGRVALFFVVVNATHVVADVVFGVLADRFGRRRVFVAFCLLFAAGQLAVALGLDALRQDFLRMTLALAAMGLGAGTWSCFGVLFAVNYPERLRATASSSFYNLSRGIQLPAQSMMVFLFAWSGTFAIALVVGAAAALASAVAIFPVTTEETDAPDGSSA